MKVLMTALALGAAMPVLPTAAMAQDAAEEAQADNAEMTAMFEADQEIRMRLMKAMVPTDDGSIRIPSDLAIEMNEGDERRFARTAELFETGALETGNDYYHAAFIFQHGSEPEHFLRAHHAAMVAMKLGHERADWIAAASLDRYLMTIERPQIYGTQSRQQDGVMGLYEADASVLTDRERAQMDVPPLAE
ncbi:hypothetical protein [Sphingomicrobium sediminis]|uniref:DUF4142 domain-containing protein n=1 Tax=Sphingomicrobium sediminis TaxID=2950949 RepID=A0A9X2ELW0_9SPHN|nr:hypothetical protein [Sphingomicrobium sediminis]MCM8557869.1 hypothetical protein [Sphingomicrobium sediminis]